jgi:hypothetical protein
VHLKYPTVLDSVKGQIQLALEFLIKSTCGLQQKQQGRNKNAKGHQTKQSCRKLQISDN